MRKANPYMKCSVNYSTNDIWCICPKLFTPSSIISGVSNSFPSNEINYIRVLNASRKHLLTKVTPDFHLTYSKNGGNLGSESK